MKFIIALVLSFTLLFSGVAYADTPSPTPTPTQTTSTIPTPSPSANNNQGKPVIVITLPPIIETLFSNLVIRIPGPTVTVDQQITKTKSVEVTKTTIVIERINGGQTQFVTVTPGQTSLSPTPNSTVTAQKPGTTAPYYKQGPSTTKTILKYAGVSVIGFLVGLFVALMILYLVYYRGRKEGEQKALGIVKKFTNDLKYDRKH